MKVIASEAQLFLSLQYLDKLENYLCAKIQRSVPVLAFLFQTGTNFQISKRFLVQRVPFFHYLLSTFLSRTISRNVAKGRGQKGQTFLNMYIKKISNFDKISMYLHIYIFNCLSGNDLANWPTLFCTAVSFVAEKKTIMHTT